MDVEPGYQKEACGIDLSLRLKNECDNWLDPIVEEIIDAAGRSQRSDLRRHINLALSIILANFLRLEFVSPGENLNISLRNRSHRSGEFNPYGVGVRALRTVVIFLSRDPKPLLARIRGVYDKKRNFKRTTQFSATKEIGEIFEKNLKQYAYARSIPIIGNTFSHHNYVALHECLFEAARKPSVRLRMGSSRDNPIFIPFDETEDTQAMRRALGVYNAFLSNHWIDLFVPDDEWGRPRVLPRRRIAQAQERERPHAVDLVAGRNLFRIFNNGGFTDGGRFYGGWWQGLPGDVRQKITIDGHPTVELDFSCMQLAMLYAKEGKNLDGDGYAVDGIDASHRDLIKTATFKLINATGNSTAPSGLPADISWKRLQEMIRERHAPIAKYLASGEGIRLQKLDADIAENVMLEMSRRGIVTLPIHDSFIVPEGHEDQLRDLMLASYQRVVGDHRIGIKKSSSLIDELLADQPGLIDEECRREAMRRFHKLKERPEYEGYRRREEWASGTYPRPTATNEVRNFMAELSSL